jgi:cell shape-determining protein MreC
MRKSEMPTGVKLKRLLFKYYIVVLFIAFLTFLAILVFDPSARNNPSVSITALGGLVSFYYFIQKQQLDELTLFKDLFDNFNSRYDSLNQSLNTILQKDESEPLMPEEISKLYDYFNLCGEEYLYYTLGYIYPEVWRAWRNGMITYLKHERIREQWLNEEKSNSYYGLTLTKLDW